MLPFFSAFIAGNSLFAIGNKTSKSRQVSSKKTSKQTLTVHDYIEVIENNTRMKQQYHAAVASGKEVESTAVLASQTCARAIAFHIRELSRIDSFIPNMEIMTGMLERDLKHLKEMSVRLCDGDKKAGELKAAQFIEDACEQFNAEQRRTRETSQPAETKHRSFLRRYFS